MIQARSSATSDSLTSHHRAGPQQGASEAASSRTRSSSSPPTAETFGQDGHATANAEDERRPSEASPTEEIRSSSPHSLGQSASMSVRGARSSSPLPNQGVPVVSNESATSMDSVEDKSDSQSSSTTTALDEEELRQLRVQASTKSSKILPPAPALPYDISYSPLSPLGLDQVGTPLSALFPLETAQKAAAASEFAKRTRKDAQAAAGEAEADREGEHLQAFAPTHHHINGKHSAHEKHKKPLPGHELERHMVSQALDQRPLPWGLQSTLISKARSAAPGRTRMGSLKRNAPQDLRTRNGKHGHSGVLTSEHSSISLGGTNGVSAGELIEDQASVKSEPELKSIEVDDATQVEPAALGDTPNESAIETPHRITEAEPSPSAEPEEMLEKTPVIENEQKVESDDVVIAPTLEAGPSNAKRRRGRPSRQETEVLATGNESEALIEGPAVGDTSVESASGSTRRPREAHKRLKMMGGYYGRQGRQSNGQTSSTEIVKQEDDVIDAMNDTERATSRDASSVPEDAVVLTNIEEAVIGDAIVQTPVTPIKASQPPSLSMGLRTPVSKAQSGIMVHAGTGPTDDNEGNNEFCETCNGAGHFICCDGCPRSFHFACINPPLDIDELPSTIGDAADKWFCNVCRTQAKVGGGAMPSAKSAKSGKKRKSLFTPLLSYIETVNPTTFSLPQDVRNYFKGVATATDGTYVDSTMLRPLKIGKFGLIDERDPFRLKDKNGKLILCYRCAQSALPLPATNAQGKADRPPRLRSSPRKSTAENGQNSLVKHSSTDDPADDKTGWRKMIGCDFCALYWHLDCLDPPLIAMPSPSRKWMCPNHIEHVVRPERIPKSTANSTSIHELPLPSAKTVGIGKHYRTRVVNEGQIDIIPDPMDTYFGPVSSSGTAAKDDNRVPSLASTVVGSSESRGKGLDKGWEEQDIPALIMSSSYKSSGLANGSNSSQQFKFKYRLPEKVIRLDFWQRAELAREQSRARWMRRVEKDSRRRIDALAQVASAAIVASSSHSDVDEVGVKGHPLPVDEAKTLVEAMFGSQAARTLYPAPSARQDEEEELLSENLEGSCDSSLRQTFVTGEYEEEFDLRSKANADPDARPSFASAVKNDQSRAQMETLADQLGVDADEVEQLRAIKALVDRQGPQAMLAFLLSNEKGDPSRAGSKKL